MSSLADLGLDRRVALVTGAQQGIGAAIAVQLAHHGAHVAINWLGDHEAALEVLKQCNAQHKRSIMVQADVSQVSQIDQMIREVHDQLGALDILVNNAGVFPRVPLLEMRESDWDSVLDINLKGTCFATIAAAKYMIKDGTQHGAVVNITSQLMAGTVRGAHYSSSKGGILSLTRSCALELAQYGIRVNAVAPGLTDTAQPRGGYSESQLLEKVQINVPLGGSLLAPEQIARGVVFLASDAADGITGQVLHINGGSYLY